MGDILASVGPQIIAVIRMLKDSELVSREVTYAVHTGDSFDEGLGYGTASTDETTLTAVRVQHTVQSAAPLKGSGIDAGDYLYVIETGDLPDGAPTMRDTITDDGVEHKIAHMEHLLSFGVLFSTKASR